MEKITEPAPVGKLADPYVMEITAFKEREKSWVEDKKHYQGVLKELIDDNAELATHLNKAGKKPSTLEAENT